MMLINFTRYYQVHSMYVLNQSNIFNSQLAKIYILQFIMNIINSLFYSFPIHFQELHLIFLFVLLKMMRYVSLNEMKIFQCHHFSKQQRLLLPHKTWCMIVFYVAYFILFFKYHLQYCLLVGVCILRLHQNFFCKIMTSNALLKLIIIICSIIVYHDLGKCH